MTSRHINERYDAAKLAVALRIARTALGYSQSETALELGISKTTLARAELMEGSLKAHTLSGITKFFIEKGVELELLRGEEIALRIGQVAIKSAAARLEDQNLRRSDRKKGAAS